MAFTRRTLIAGLLGSVALPAQAVPKFPLFTVHAPSGGGGPGSAQTQISGAWAPVNRALSASTMQDFTAPGNESPAISTADYYNTGSVGFLHPFLDLDACGAVGATVKADNGGNRYVWLAAFDHPTGGDSIHTDSWGMTIGFSNDPAVFPLVTVNAIPSLGSFVGDATTPGLNGIAAFWDWCPSSLVYNPDDASFPFYLYTQGTNPPTYGTQSILWKSSNLFDWVGGAWGPANIDTTDPGLQYNQITVGQFVTRRGTGDWISYGITGLTSPTGTGMWASTDGKVWTYSSTIYNVTGYSSVNLSMDAGSGTPKRLTAASAIFSPSDTGKGLVVQFLGAGGLGGVNPSAPVAQGGTQEILTYVSPTEVDLQYNNSFTISAAAAPLEFGAISVRSAPAPSVLGGLSTMGGFGNAAFAFGDAPQLYQVVNEDARHPNHAEDDGQWATLAPIDSTYNVSQSVSAIRVSTQFNGGYPGINYLQQVGSYLEDGICFVFPISGYPGPHATAYTPIVGATVTGGIGAPSSGISVFDVDSIAAAGGYIPLGAYVAGPPSGTVLIGQILDQISGTPNGVGSYHVSNLAGNTVAAHTANIIVNSGSDYLVAGFIQNGWFGHQFVDVITMAYDSILASDAAPFGVSASCSSNTVTISWMDTPLGTGAKSQSYNVYRGTSAGSQTTLLGNTSSLTMTDTPTPGSQYWYKVMKVSGGSETKSRVVNTYVG